MASYKILSISLRPEVAEWPDGLSRAAYILQTCMEAEGLTKRDLYQYFNINRKLLMRRLWSMLLGYTSHSVSKTKYLAEKFEKELAEKIRLKTEQHDSPSCSQVITWVRQLPI